MASSTKACDKERVWMELTIILMITAKCSFGLWWWQGMWGYFIRYQKNFFYLSMFMRIPRIGLHTLKRYSQKILSTEFITLCNGEREHQLQLNCFQFSAQYSSMFDGHHHDLVDSPGEYINNKNRVLIFPSSLLSFLSLIVSLFFNDDVIDRQVVP